MDWFENNNTYNDAMVTLNAHFDGKNIVPDEPPDLAAGTRLRVTLEPINKGTPRPVGKLELPLLTGVDPQVVRAMMEDPDFDIDAFTMEASATPASRQFQPLNIRIDPKVSHSIASHPAFDIEES